MLSTVCTVLTQWPRGPEFDLTCETFCATFIPLPSTLSRLMCFLGKKKKKFFIYPNNP